MRIGLFYIFITISFFTKAQESITIYGNQELDSSYTFMQGFLHGGIKSLDTKMVTKLRPAFWRLGAYFNAGSSYEDAQKYNPKTTIVLNDLYMITYNITSQTQSKPWLNNWKEWDNVVSMVVKSSVDNRKPVDYWDLWGEPDNFWTGTSEQFIEMYRRTDSIIHSISPKAKIVGPEWAFASCNFSVQPILSFLKALQAKSVSIDALSWHEFCQPEDVERHVKQLRDSLNQQMGLGQIPIHISEYGGPQNHTIPAWNVGWLHYLEKAKVQWASHACWDESDGMLSWSNCEIGLNGLFMRDNKTPQPNYWVHRAYAELGNFRLNTSSSHTKTVALSGVNKENKELKILVGRYDSPQLGTHNAPANVEIKIKNYPFGSNTSQPLFIQKIPSSQVPYSVPLKSPVNIQASVLRFTADSASVFINNFIDGDVYIIYINPNSASILQTVEQTESQENDITVSPNPVRDIISVKTEKKLENAEMNVVNTLGVSVIQRKNLYGNNFTFNTNQLSDGLYSLQIIQNGRVVSVSKFLIVR